MLVLSNILPIALLTCALIQSSLSFTTTPVRTAVIENLSSRYSNKSRNPYLIKSMSNPNVRYRSSQQQQKNEKNKEDLPLLSMQSKPRVEIELASISTDETCEIGVNTVNECETVQGTQTKFSAISNLAKCINGAGSFALPHVFLDEGIIGGTIALTVCGILATYTMQLLLDLKVQMNSNSYVDLARSTLGNKAATLVFALTLSASLGVCSSYIVFLGQTLESLSSDATSTNIIRQILPDVNTVTWEIVVAGLVFPLTLLRSYGIFAFTSVLGIIAVLGGILVTLSSGMFVDPGGGIAVAFQNVLNQPMFPNSLGSAIGNSFGTVAFLFCVNFLTFPIMNSMKDPEEYKEGVPYAVCGTAIFNIIFAALCVGFYGEDTADLVLSNLGNGPYLSSLKLLLCVDLLFTFPIVFSSGRQIMENALIGVEQNALFSDDSDSDRNTSVQLKRAGIAGGGVLICLSLAQIGGFGTIANLVGGVAQGTLAFVLPPLIAVLIARNTSNNGEGGLGLTEFTLSGRGGEITQLILGIFGVFVVLCTSYFTILSIIS